MCAGDPLILLAGEMELWGPGAAQTPGMAEPSQKGFFFSHPEVQRVQAATHHHQRVKRCHKSACA